MNIHYLGLYEKTGMVPIETPINMWIIVLFGQFAQNIEPCSPEI